MKKRIKSLIKEGANIKTEFFFLHYREPDFYKTGFLVSRKLGNTVRRNYIKRIVREFWRKNFERGDFLFAMKKGVSNKTRVEIIRVLKKAAEEIKCGKF
jgi:ribonuclease P protein component